MNPGLHTVQIAIIEAFLRMTSYLYPFGGSCLNSISFRDGTDRLDSFHRNQSTIVEFLLFSLYPFLDCSSTSIHLLITLQCDKCISLVKASIIADSYSSTKACSLVMILHDLQPSHHTIQMLQRQIQQSSLPLHHIRLWKRHPVQRCKVFHSSV